MVFTSFRVFVLLLCVGLLSVQPEKVLCIRKLVHPLGQIQEQRIMLQNQPTQTATSMEATNTKKKKMTEHVGNRIDPNQSSKRRVRRGSDPIHNRY
ncbi:hypothetical protein K1719_017145 [Acacia pycnantha]|nr:hypothetical protein K1719_017145 [Acacia pycnantha]